MIVHPMNDRRWNMPIVLMTLSLMVLVATAAHAAWDLHESPYFSEFTKLQRLPSGPIFAGNQGGLFVSMDEGSTWTFSGLGSLDDPNAGNDIHFDAVEMSNGAVYAVMEYAYRASPDLMSWTRVAWPFGLESVVAVGDTLVAATSLQIHRSIDAGATWTEVFTDSGNWDDIVDLHVNPVDSTMVAHMERAGGIWFLVSHDFGATWVEQQIAGVYGDLFSAQFAADGTLWFGHNYFNKGYLRTTTDFGASSTLVYETPSNTPLHHLTLGPANRMAMTRGAGIVVSTDGGASFTPYSLDVSWPEPLFFTGGERLLAGTKDGLRISEDEGQSWTPATSGLWANIMIDADVDPDNTVWILSSGRIWHDMDGSWHRLDMPGGVAQQTAALRATATGRVILFGRAASGEPEAYYTDDHGASWFLSTGLDAATSFNTFNRIFERGGTLYAGHDGLGLFVSTDNGTSWTLRGAGGFGPLAVAGDGTLYASGWQGLRKSVDDGVTWSPITTTTANEPGVASTVTGAYIIPGWNELLRTTDGGATWTDLMPAAYAALDSYWFVQFDGMGYGADGSLYLAIETDDTIAHRHETRLLKSTDDGATFNDITEDSPINRAVVTSLKLSAQGGMIATSNQGLFGSAFSGISQVEPGDGGFTPQLPTTWLGRNRPNPFNPLTVIPFSMGRPGIVRLTVTDVRGRHVATLVDHAVAVGDHTVSFDASQLSSGVYLYHLQTGDEMQTGRMTLVK